MEREKRDEITSIKIVFPSGRGIALNISPFYICTINAVKTGISLQHNDDLENAIILSDVCEIIGTIAIALASACTLTDEPIVCAIAALIETIYELIC